MFEELRLEVPTLPFMLSENKEMSNISGQSADELWQAGEKIYWSQGYDAAKPLPSGYLPPIPLPQAFQGCPLPISPSSGYPLMMPLPRGYSPPMQLSQGHQRPQAKKIKSRISRKIPRC